MSDSKQDPLSRWEPGSLVPLPDLARSVGMNKDHVSYALKNGLIEPDSKRGRNGRFLITWDQALMLVAAAALAAAAGMAIVTILRALKETGAECGPAGVVIPLRGAA